MQTAPTSERSPALPALVRRIAQGDRTAFAALYDETAPKLFGVALRILRQRDLAEDVVQESFVAAWERAGEFDPVRGSVMAWLVTIVRHRAIDLLRRRGSRADTRSDGDAALLALAGPETERADRGADLAALQRCLDELEAQPRRVVLMSYAYGYTHEELAETLKVPAGTVKSWIRRSLERLHRCLDA
jgi:RNA polymerase sigma-70 factor, ECF subfamily